MQASIFCTRIMRQYLPTWRRSSILLWLAFCLNACATDLASTPLAPSNAAANTVQNSPPRSARLLQNPAHGEVNYSCTTAVDCVVKNVGNCCGYYPGCVNASSPTFPDQVRAQCTAQKMHGVCGFPADPGCQCVAHKCVTTAGPGHGGGAVE
jgi:hypothetical protein